MAVGFLKNLISSHTAAIGQTVIKYVFSEKVSETGKSDLIRVKIA
jgi:hypothetical protein